LPTEEPRFTNDIDIVVDLDEESLAPFCDGFPDEDFYLSREAAREAVRDRGTFNVIHPSSGLKIDVILPKQSGYDDQRLDRAMRVTIDEGFDAKFTTPEDIILKKLQWHEMGGGDRHLRDIAGILKVRRSQIDFAYIEENTRTLQVEDLWRQVLHITQGS
jgi:hypothetical protein